MRVGTGIRRLGLAASGTGIAVGVAGASYLTLIGAAAMRRSAPLPQDAPPRRYRILVPAHDEERTLPRTLEALAALDAGHDCAVVVIADNCTDATADVARRLGAQVLERHDPTDRGKGAALAWAIDRLPAGAPDDVIVVIDADTIVRSDLLHAFDRAFEASDVAAVQGFYRVLDDTQGGEVGFRSAAFAVRHLLRPLGRTALGGSSSLVGNGMAFRDPITRQYRWSNDLTEDLDMGLRLLLDGHDVGFAADAVVEGEMPDTLDAAASQNERWEAGRLAVARRHLPGLLDAARRRAHGSRWRYLDAAVDIALPPLTTLGAATTVAGAGWIVSARGRRVRAVGAGAAGTALGLQILHLVQALRRADVPPAVWRALVRAPVHMIWKSQVVVRMTRARPTTWTRTARRGESAA